VIRLLQAGTVALANKITCDIFFFVFKFTGMLTEYVYRFVFIITIATINFLLTGKTCLAQQPDSTFLVRTETQHRYGLVPSTPLSARVTQTPEDVLSKFKEAGMSPREHQLTEAERTKVAAAFAALPPLHQRVLKERLKSISFLDDMPNTALTSTLNFDERYNLYHITIRAAILNENVSQWLTGKERTCFDTLHSPISVSVEGGTLNALVYVLIHETTHVVDASLGITNRPDGKLLDPSSAGDFAAGIWEDRTIVVPRFRESLLQGIIFRRGGKALPVDQAETVYKALQKTPFVSLYGSCARSEDLAEFITVYHMTHQLKQPFKIVIGSNNKKLFEYEPMKSDIVKSRIEQIKYFYGGS
jgi:hypothetical protein